jgi:DNA-binding GntR family transcriptional regulator
MPSYLVVANAIRELIEAGEYAPGDELPTTARIAEEYGVSDHTAYLAMRFLRDQGIIRTVQGGGRYVAGDDDDEGDANDTED